LRIFAVVNVLHRMREVLEAGRHDPASLVHGLASLVPGVFCSFSELDLPTRRQLSYRDNYGGPLEMTPDDPYWRLPSAPHLSAPGGRIP